jgi:hypothetical protein
MSFWDSEPGDEPALQALRKLAAQRTALLASLRAFTTSHPDDRDHDLSRVRPWMSHQDAEREKAALKQALALLRSEEQRLERELRAAPERNEETKQ